MRKFSPGIRLSRLDIVILVVAFPVTIGLGVMTWWWGFVVGFVGGNFFLFCNVFRVARPLELAWSALFLTLAGATVVFEVPGWFVTASVSLAVTSVVILVEMRKPSYHGIGWQRINPSLPAWWESQGR